MGARPRLLMNPAYDPGAPYPATARAVISLEAFVDARRIISGWPEYATTPLIPLPETAARAGLAAVWLKDEGARFGLGSFKAVGGAYGALRALQAELEERYGIWIEARRLRAGDAADEVGGLVLACATDGNHGCAVAWAARALGCACEVYVPSIVSGARRRRIEALGARVRGIAGTYDDAVRALAAAAREHGWIVVSDQAYAGNETVPRAIMQGYATIAEEVLEQLDGERLPTHVFVQAGVGGFAAAVCGHLWERLGSERPRLVCVEPGAADCLYRSAAAGALTPVPGELETVMACLSCGEASPLAWSVLAEGAAAFLAIEDEDAVAAMRELARPGGGQRPVVAGESGAAGLAGLLRICADTAARDRLGLEDRSRVLLFATEEATDPEAYASLVGMRPEEVAGGRTCG